jgi:predicted nucleic-acid-binding protein
MIAADTNVIVRLIIRDDEAQYSASVGLLQQGPIFVSLTVLLETGWVLEHTLKLPRASVVTALSGILRHEMMTIENETEADWALGRYEQGADLADMIHLAANHEMEGFATFDRKIAKQAGQMPVVPIMLLPRS